MVTAGEIDGIDVAVFAQGVGEAPKGFGVSRGDDAKAVVGGANEGFALHFAVEGEARGELAVGNEDKLAEVGAVGVDHGAPQVVEARDADDGVPVFEGAVAESRDVALFLLAVYHQRADVFAGGGVVGGTGVEEHVVVGGVGLGEGEFGLDVVPLVDVERHAEHRVALEPHFRGGGCGAHAVEFAEVVRGRDGDAHAEVIIIVV